jgi:SulP family sulfate permease
VLSAIGVLDRLAAAGRVFPEHPQAIAAARAHLREAGPVPA